MLVTEDRLTTEGDTALSLVDALSTPPAKTKIDKILSEVTEAEREALLEALGGSVWSSEALAELLKAQGHITSETSIRRYRRNVLGVTG